MKKLLNIFIKFSVYALVLLMPLLWLPWTGEAFEFNKQYALFFLVGVGFVSWLAKMIVVRKKFVLRRTPLDIWVMLFMAATVLSAALSIDPLSSWFGSYGRFSDSAVGILSLGILYFLVVNNLRVEDSGKGISLRIVLRLFAVSGWIAVLTAYCSIFGLWARIGGLPVLMKLKSFNPVAGSLEGLAVFLAVLTAYLVGYLIVSRVFVVENASFFGGEVKKPSRIGSFLNILLLIAATGLLVVINFRDAWIVLAITMFVLILLAFWTRVFREKVNLLVAPITILLICLVYLLNLPGKVGFLSDAFFVRNDLPREVLLDWGASGKVAWESVKEHPITGSGPGTYLADFAKAKPVAFNETAFWNIRFDRSGSHLLELAGSMGIVGLLSYFLVAAIFLLIGIILFSRSKIASLSKYHLRWVFPLVLGWLTLFFAQIFYWQSTAAAFFFWLFTALTAVVWQKAKNAPAKKISISFSRLPEVGLVLNVVLMVLVFVLAGLFYLAGRFYLADLAYVRSFTAQDIGLAVANLEKAVNYNQYRRDYRQALSQAYLVMAWEEANKDEKERNVELLQRLAGGAIGQARSAAEMGEQAVGAWENLGAIYRDSRGLVGGTLPFAVEALLRASELEPHNPFFYRELCRLTLIDEENTEKNWDQTVGYCQKAIELKQNYLDAHVQLALVYEQKGDLQEAVNRMKGALGNLQGASFQRGSQLAGAATEIYFQLGRLYFNLNQMAEAIKMFEQAVIITPGYANARYGLALSYKQNGRTEDALTQLRIVDELVPGNENVAGLIRQMEGGVVDSSQ